MNDPIGVAFTTAILFGDHLGVMELELFIADFFGCVSTIHLSC